MNYAKPEVTFVSAASAAVRGQGKIHQQTPDAATSGLPFPQQKVTVPAYEADE